MDTNPQDVLNPLTLGVWFHSKTIIIRAIGRKRIKPVRVSAGKSVGRSDGTLRTAIVAKK
jgi:hypothetical protein